MEDSKQKTYLDYLDKTYLEELNLKIWSTRGARFRANQRLIVVARLSNLCASLFSVYLIAVGLLSVYNFHTTNQFGDNVLAYTTTCLSILLLVFTQTESAKDYSKRALEYHNCALELSELYGRLRIFKTLNSNATEEEKTVAANDISNQYEQILQKHQNHLDIDFDIFRTTKASYYLMSKAHVRSIRLQYYLKIYFPFHFLMLSPPIGIAVLVYFSQ